MPDYSYKQTSQITCPQCGVSLTAQMWLILDAAARPDLLDALRRGALHTSVCANGHPIPLDLPLLLYRPGEDATLLFSPAEQTSQEEDQQHANALLGMLRDALGAAWNAAWVEQMPVVPRRLLPPLLADDPEAALAQMQAAMAAEMERLRQEDPERFAQLEQAARDALVEAGNEPEETSPATTEPAMEAVLRLVNVHSLEEHQRVLRADQALLLTDAAAQALAELIQQYEDDPNALRQLQMHQRVLQRAQDVGMEAALTELVAQAQTTSAAPPLLVRLQEFIQAETWDQSQRIVAQNPDLLTDEADALLTQLCAAAEAQGEEDAARHFTTHRDLLRRCREIGIEAAFAEIIGAGQTASSTPAAFRQAWQQAQTAEAHYLQTGDIAFLHEAIAAWESILRHRVFPTADARFRLAVLNDSGGCYLRRYWARGQTSDLNQALAQWRQAVQATPAGSPDLPGYLNNLGNGLRDRYAARGSFADLEEAIAVYRQAVALWQDRLLWQSDPGVPARAAAQLNRRLLPLLLAARDEAAAPALIEAGRSVRLRAEQARLNRRPAQLSPAEATAYDQMLADLRQCDSDLRALAAEPRTPQLDIRRAALVRRRRDLLERLRHLEAADPVFALRAPEYAALRDLARSQNRLLLYLAPTDDTDWGTLCLLIHPASPQDAPAAADIISLPAFTRDAWQDFFYALFPTDGFGAADVPGILAQAAAGQQPGWLTAYWLTHLAHLPALHPLYPLAQAVWQRTMTQRLAQLGRAFLPPLLARLAQLPDVWPITLLPGDLLAFLPWHAVPLPDGDFFGDRYVLSYAPSAVALEQAITRAAARPQLEPHLTAIANPDGSLAFTPGEVRAIAARFAGRAQVAFGSAARRAWLLEHAPAADYLELSTHASFHPSDPGQSAFLLAHPQGYTAPLWQALPARQPLNLLQADCEKLTLDDIWAGRLPLKPGCLVSASACETGQIDRGAAEEHLGFPAALLTAGAGTVIASLWAVDDLSTAWLMDKTYELLLPPHHLPPATAVQQAAHWLRTLPKADALARLETELAPLQAAEARGEWTILSEEAEADLYYQLLAMESAYDTLHESTAACPFSHPVHWAPFAVHGA